MDWFPQRSVCYATMELISANARYEALHKDLPFHDGTFQNWAPERSRSHPYRFDDAVSIWVAPVDLAPDDDFLARPSAGGDDSDASEDEHEA